MQNEDSEKSEKIQQAEALAARVSDIEAEVREVLRELYGMEAGEGLHQYAIQTAREDLSDAQDFLESAMRETKAITNNNLPF